MIDWLAKFGGWIRCRQPGRTFEEARSNPQAQLLGRSALASTKTCYATFGDCSATSALGRLSSNLNAAH
jgi:hypothetical protein